MARQISGSGALNFEQACERWRDLLRCPPHAQARLQARYFGRHPAVLKRRRQAERPPTERLRNRSASLTGSGKTVVQFRFLQLPLFCQRKLPVPGYSFFFSSAFGSFRAGVKRKIREEYLSRPRFLAISEFGPRRCRLPRRVTLPHQSGHPAVGENHGDRTRRAKPV